MSDATRPEDELSTLRQQLDTVDADLVQALSARQRLVERVATLKRGAPSRPLRDTARESALLGRIERLAAGGGLDPDFVVRLYQEILDHSVRQQQLKLSPEAARRAAGHLVVAHLGGPGSYSAQAARRHFEAHEEAVVFRTGLGFGELVAALRDGSADYAVLPLENTTAGSITEVYDLLAEGGLFIIGEEVMPIEHCLIALEASVPIARIRRICSHPQALAQCRGFIRRLPGVIAEAVSDTDAAVAQVKAQQDLSQGAIASEAAARLHGLAVVQRGVADHAQNFTRFVIVARAPKAYAERVPCKTSVIFSAQHRHGALVQALQVFAQHGLNLTKLESRPQPGQPWVYRFYVDFEGHGDDPQVQRALTDLKASAAEVRVLGTYPARTTAASAPAAPKAPTPAPSEVASTASESEEESDP
ncbi:MAG: prephenate dehydratase [Bradymonadia bacterium]